MNIKLIGDPAAASSLLRMITLSDGLGEVVKAAPPAVREVGQQLLNKATGTNGDALTRVDEPPTDNGVGTLASMLPQLIALTERTLDIDKLKGKTVAQVAAEVERKTSGEDRELAERAHRLITALPIVADMPFDEVYLRATAGK
jgi:hypothetical protein